MSIFSRKSKSSQPQAVAAKPSGQPYQPGPKPVPSESVPDGGPVDPIVQRMAIQAASRRRMNSEQPDYSIQSTQGSPARSLNISPTMPAQQSPLPSPGLKSYDLVQTISAVSAISGVSVADAGVAPIETMNAGKQDRDPNKLKKKSSGQISPQYTPQAPQMPFASTAMRSDPDLQKVRMPNREYFHSSPHLSKDSGYASIAPAATMDSRTLTELNGTHNAELARRHYQTDASLPRTAPGDGAYQDRAATFAGRSWNDNRSRSVYSSGISGEGNRRDSGSYVSRLDPGPASSSFLTSSVVPEISKSRSASNSSAERGLRPSIDQSEAGLDTTTTAPETSMYDATRSPRTFEDFGRPTPNMSRVRESQPRQVKQQTKDRRASLQSQTKSEEPIKFVPSTSPTQAPIPVSTREKDLDGKVLASPLPGSFPLTPDTQERDESLAPERVPTPPPSELPEKKSPDAVKALGLPSNEAQDSEKSSKYSSTSDTLPTEDVTSKGVLNGDALVPASDSNRGFEASNQLAQASSEFAWLDGAAANESAVPTVSALEGFKVNKKGQILDEEGDVIGELVEGDIARCVRQKVNAKGDVVDASGNIVGRAIPMMPSTVSQAFQMQDGTQQTFGHIQTPTEATKSQEAAILQPATQVVPERALNNAASTGNTFAIELDASMESQAAPLVDQSEIFSPFAGSKVANNVMPVQKDEKKAQPRRHTLRASQEQRTLEQAQRQSKGKSRVFDGKSPVASSSAAGVISRDFSSEPSDRPRSMSMLGSTKASEAPRAVLGPTLGSLLETVPDRSQRSQSLSLKTGQPNGVSTGMSQRGSPTRASTGSLAEVTQSSSGGAGVAGGAMAARARRASQQNLNGKNPAALGRSPLSGAPTTPPDNANGNIPSDEEFRKQLQPSPMGTKRNASSKGLSRLVEEDDNQSDVAAPAPIIKKPATAAVAAKPKRKSIFGLPIGKRIDPAVAR